jgi:predicted Fe-S protein YdhL (DUF1289 family)
MLTLFWSQMSFSTVSPKLLICILDSKETKVFGCKRVDVNVIIIWIILDNKETK